MVVDEYGNVTIDTIEIPSACLCHAKSTFGLRRSGFRPIPLKMYCKMDETSKSIAHKKFNRGNVIFDNSEITRIQAEILSKAAASLKPCISNELQGTKGHITKVWLFYIGGRLKKMYLIKSCSILVKLSGINE